MINRLLKKTRSTGGFELSMGSLWVGRIVAGMELLRGAVLRGDLHRIFWEDGAARHDFQQAQMVPRSLGVGSGADRGWNRAMATRRSGTGFESE